MYIGVEVYDPEHPSMNYVPPSTGMLLNAARGVLASSGELYDPEAYEMNVSPKHPFKYHVSMALWDMALQETKNTRALLPPKCVSRCATRPRYERRKVYNMYHILSFPPKSDCIRCIY